MIECMKRTQVADKLRFVDIHYIDKKEEKIAGELLLRIW
jgi:hypothetical protein